MVRFSGAARRPLTVEEELELLIGPGRVPGEQHPVSEFESDAARRAAWVAHREEILDAYPATWAGERYEGANGEK